MVTKRYHPPHTPCARLLQADSIAMDTKSKLREVSANLDPLKLLPSQSRSSFPTIVTDNPTMLTAISDQPKSGQLPSESPVNIVGSRGQHRSETSVTFHRNTQSARWRASANDPSKCPVEPAPPPAISLRGGLQPDVNGRKENPSRSRSDTCLL